MTTEEKYIKLLNDIRKDFSLLENYRFNKDVENSNHFEQLCINIAIYNDLEQSDYEIAKFLFLEENKWRRSPKDGEVDNLYFSAFVLTLFERPESIWLFLNSKNIDFDSYIGFDGEYLIALGVEKTYDYLSKVENPNKNDLLKYIGETRKSCWYSEELIEKWNELKENYFSTYKFPAGDELCFLINEKKTRSNIPQTVRLQWLQRFFNLFSK